MKHRDLLMALTFVILPACSSAEPDPAPEPRPSVPSAFSPQGLAFNLGAAIPDCEEFCIDIDKDKVAVGEVVTGAISWRGAPPNSVMFLSLDRTQGDRQRIQNERAREPGRLDSRFDGSLIDRPIPIEGDGSIRFTWSGNGFGCYRTEIPEICPGEAAPGLHVITAKVLDKFTIVHPFSHPDTRRKAKPKMIFEGKSRVFEIR